MKNEDCYQCEEIPTDQLPASNAFPDAHVPFCPDHARQRWAEMAEAGIR